MNFKFLKSLSAYTFVGVFGAGVNFVVMPILSHHLSPEDYGVLSIFNAYVTIVIPLIGLVSSGLTKVEYYKIDDKREFASLFSTVQLIPVLPFLVLLSICHFFQIEVSRILEIPEAQSKYLVLIPIIALLTIVNETFLGYLVVTKKSSVFLISNMVKLSIEVGLTMLFVIYFKWGWQGRILSWLVVSVLLTLVAVLFFNKQKLLTTSIKYVYFKAGIAYGLPLILHTLGKFVINQSDRLFIVKMVSLSEAGVYNIGYQIGAAIMIVVTAFQNVYLPFLFERLKNLTEKNKLEIVRLSYGYLVVLFIGIVVLTILTPFLFRGIIDGRYIEGGKYVFWVSLSYLFWGGYMIFSAFIFYYKKNNILGYLSIVNVVLNLSLNYIFINLFGALGAAFATCVSFFVVLIVVAVYANRLVALPWLNFKAILSISKIRNDVQ